MDSSGEALHPNWRALATVSYPLKRFVRSHSSDSDSNATNDNTNQQLQGNNCVDMVKFYEEELNTAASSDVIQVWKTVTEQIQKKDVTAQQPERIKFEPQKFFRLAMCNNVEEMAYFDYQANDINICDDFGWTALMMAATEGATEAVIYLLKLGADKHICDASGHTAAELAHKKGHYHIEALLRENKVEEAADVVQDKDMLFAAEQSAREPFYCDICKRSFHETTLRKHQTSTLHQFNMTPSTSSVSKLQKFNIPETNRGLKLMVKQGWDRESGLGPTQSGRLYPVETVIRKERTGLGIAQKPARVTHFEKCDGRHNSCNCNKTKPRNRNDIKREKQREWRRERRLRKELS